MTYQEYLEREQLRRFVQRRDELLQAVPKARRKAEAAEQVLKEAAPA